MNLKLGEKTVISLKSILKNLLFALNAESSIVKWSGQLCLMQAFEKEKKVSTLPTSSYLEKVHIKNTSQWIHFANGRSACLFVVRREY